MAKTYSAPPPMTIDPSHNYVATMKTDKGNVKIELFPKDAPATVNNFVFLAREGFYDGVTFHRVIPGFMAQGGDPTGRGNGGPGYQFKDEFSAQTHQAGSLSMANAGPNTNGSQFFICYEPQPHLNGRHTVFGKVIEGMDVVRSFNERDPQRGGPPAATIQSIEIEETAA
jgi:peptidyl-prolyl cis-trans isomerase B (cyclophilin B)